MWPVLFDYGTAAVTSYSMLVGIGFLVALWVWVGQAKRCGVPPERIINLAFQTLIVSFVGARLLFVFTEWQDFARGNYRIWALWEGGVVFYGGFIASGLFLWWALPRQKIARSVGFHTLAPAVAIGHAFGRIGCFLNGCCYGDHCDLPWAVSYTNPLTFAPKNYPVHPVQLYESAALFALGLFLLLRNQKARQNPWPNWMIYFFVYPPIRFGLEFLRGDPERGSWAGLSTSQWISIVLFFMCVFLAFRRPKRHNSAHVQHT